MSGTFFWLGRQVEVVTQKKVCWHTHLPTVQTLSERGRGGPLDQSHRIKKCVFYLKVRQSVFYSSFQCLYWALGWSEGDLDLIDVRVDFGERGVLEGGWSEVKDFLRRGSGSLTQASLPQLQISLFQGVFLA